MVATATNRFLSSLSSGAQELIRARATALPIPVRTSLYEPEQTPKFAYFITSGMASIVTTTEEGETVEVGIVGSEGLVGGLHLIGPTAVTTRSFMQIEGSALRIPYQELRKLYRSSEEIRDQVLEFVQQQALTVTHIAACNRLHEAEPRLARWLLMARDRTGSDVLDITQEFLGTMLGAQRTTVNLLAAAFQRLGAIDYVRGRVTILDAPKLEEFACDCYQAAKKLHVNLYRGKQS